MIREQLDSNKNWGLPDDEYLKVNRNAALDDQRDVEVDAALSSEEAARILGDAALQSDIDTIVAGSSVDPLTDVRSVKDVTNTNDYVVTYGTGAPFDKLKYLLEVTNTNTGASTLNSNGTGAEPILWLRDGVAYPVPSGMVIGKTLLEYSTVYGGYIAAGKEEIVYTPRMLGGGLVINGNFDIWQRGTSFLGIISEYTVDRFKLITNVGGTLNVNRVISDNPLSESKYSLDVSVGGTFPTIITTIENPNNYIKNKETTLSFWVKGASAFQETAKIRNAIRGIELSKNYNITTDWTKQTLVFPANSNWLNDDNIDVLLAFTMNDDAKFEQVKLEIGDIATDFIPKTYAEELRDCNRYINVPSSEQINEVVGDGFAVNTITAIVQIDFSERMRIVPSLSVTPANYLLWDGVTTIACTTISIRSGVGGRERMVLECVVASGLTQFRPYKLIGVTSDVKMIFDAEL